MQADAEAMPARRWLALFLIYLVFVVYGSLVPLAWRPVPWEEALTRFANIPYLDLGAVSRADWVANIILYVPLAFLGCAAILGLRVRSPWLSVAGAAAIFSACVALAFGVEFTQIFFAPRTVSQNDLIAETIGAAIGVLIWLLARWRVVELGAAFARGGRPSVLAALIVFGLAYLVFSLFPFDFVVSGAELRAQLPSGLGEWLFGSCAGWVRCLAFWGAEVAALVPAGVLLGLLYPRLGWVRLLLIGLAVGILLETLQLLLVSGQSEGISALLRGVGLALGGGLAWLLTWRLSVPSIAGLLWRAGPFLLLPYLIGLLAVSGWFSGQWYSLETALSRLGGLGWVPFYYHYWTSEPVAMVSLLSQLAMYMPLGVLFWSRRASLPSRGHPVWLPAFAALALAVLVEAGKLFASGARPDPTNLLIAPAGALLAYYSMLWFERVLSQGTAPAAAPAAANWRSSVADAAASASSVGQPATSVAAGHAQAPLVPRAHPATGVARAADIRLPEPRPWGYLYAMTFGTAAVVGVVVYPLWNIWLAMALLLLAAALWRWPSGWLILVPCLLPVLDLTPFSGRVLLSAFDLVMLVGLAVVGLRLSGIRPARLPNAWVTVALVLLALSWSMSTFLGLAPSAGGEEPLASSHPILAPWHEGKGLLWALLAVPLLRRFRRRLGSTASVRLVLAGAVIGIGITVAVVLWERGVYVGLLDLSSEFRVTGPFASMHDGGGYIGAYLAFALPLLLGWTLTVKPLWLKALGVSLAALAVYALVVTFARGAYLGAVVGVAVLVGGLMAGGLLRQWWHWVLVAGVPLLAGLVLVPLLMGGFAEDRLSRVGADLQSRLGHWERAVGLAGVDAPSVLFGVGLGRYPALALFASSGGTPPGTFEVLDEGDNAFLRLGKGQPVFLDQPVSVRPGVSYRLSARVRGASPGAAVTLFLCDKALLYSFGCVSAELSPSEPGIWEQAEAQRPAGELGGGWLGGPVKLSLYNAGRGVVDVDDLSLRAADGRELVANGGFDSGAERWLFVTDQAQAWHIDQLLVETYVAQGLLGLLALACLLVAAVLVLWPGIRAGRLEAVAFAAALAGLFSAGMVGSVVDAPRTGMLFYLGLFCAVLLVRGPDPKRRRAKRRRAGPEVAGSGIESQGMAAAEREPGALAGEPPSIGAEAEPRHQ